MSIRSEHIFYISGMHCASCAMLIHDTIHSAKLADEVFVDQKSGKLTIHAYRGPHTEVVKIAEELTILLSPHGYSVDVTMSVSTRPSIREYMYGLGIAFVVLLLFVFFQRLGLDQRIGVESFGIGSAIFIGVLASLSTCLAVVGGLVLGVSARYAEQGRGRQAVTMFHIGRLVGFAVLGGALGLLGSVFYISFTAMMVINVVVAFAMIVIGLHLLGVKIIQQSNTSWFESWYRTRESSKAGPLLVGAITFFLPCGFTQAMQLQALSTGSMIQASSIMFAFAIGTLPVLAGIGYGMFSFSKSRYAGIAYYAAGFMVVVLGLYTMYNVGAGLGFVPVLSIF